MQTAVVPPIPEGATYPVQLRTLAEKKPNKLAYVFYDAQLNKIDLTRSDVWVYSQKYAAILKRHGVQRGDIVCNTLVNSPERLLSALGTVVAGAVSMHGQVFLADGEDLIHNCKVAKCSTIIVDPGQENGAWTILKRIQHADDTTGEVRFAGLPDLVRVLHFRVCPSPDEPRGLGVLELEGEMFQEENIVEEDMAFVFSTSGTTGFSKQVARSHRFCLTSGRTSAILIGVQSDEAACFLPNNLGWSGGFPSFYPGAGCTRVLVDHCGGVPERFDTLLRKISNECGTSCGFLSTPMIESLMKSLKAGEGIEPLFETVATGGMPISQSIVNAVGVIAETIKCMYGLTEAWIVSIHVLRPGMSYEDYCVGGPVEGCDVRVLGDDQQELPPGKVGQVAIRSPWVLSGYLNQPELMAASMSKDGAFMPSDIGYKDDKGRLYILGRAKEAIHRGSFIHYPGWLEGRIQKCTGVENAAVIGVPDPVYHEEICACVIPSKGDNLSMQQLRDYCDNLTLADKFEEISAKVKYFLIVQSFPYNQNGKLDRKLLRAMACDQLGIENK